MCGVIGYIANEVREEDVETLCRIFEQSKIRGLHSSGYSYMDGTAITTRKFFEIDDLLSSLRKLEKKVAGKPFKLIGHTRYSTSGDWENHKNNQPLDLGEISLVFNGCIHMGLRSEYEQAYGKKYTTDNDGEIFCRKVLDGDDWEYFISTGTFSFAGAFLYEGAVHVIRNRNRPLWMGVKQGTTFLASTQDIFKRAEFKGLTEEVAPCMAHRIS